jgi:hypothetical protein
VSFRRQDTFRDEFGKVVLGDIAAFVLNYRLMATVDLSFFLIGSLPEISGFWVSEASVVM